MSGAVERRVLLIGGSSEIGLAIVRRLAAEGPVRPYLLGRDQARLDDALAVLARDGCAPGEDDHLEANDLDSHADVLARAFERAGGFDVVVLAIGVLGAQAGLDADPRKASEVMRVNFDGCGSLLLHSMRLLRDQEQDDAGAARNGEAAGRRGGRSGGRARIASGRPRRGRARGRPPGTIVVLSTVAAERPRAGNAIYGAAKAGLDALAQGLADATAGTGVRVLVVRPGFVRTRMTAGLPAAPFSTTPDAVAEATARALGGGRAHTVWVPRALRVVFAVLRHLPRPLYRRLPL